MASKSYHEDSCRFCAQYRIADIASVQEGIYVTLDPVNGTILAKKHG